MIQAESILIDYPAATPEQAIEAAGNALQAAGACSADYVRAMVDNYHHFGPYFVIAPGLAMPHARPEQGACRAQLSLVRLRAPIAFGHEENDPVSLLLGLAAGSSDDHIALITHIATLLSEPDSLALLMHCDQRARLFQLLHPSPR
ncbi:PTS sugar transporter subunit IIA [Affinibrenneria salicis]|uniref:Ascorbate-specific PTS system EIIA component n=1 Tax=Affinibrenneria salicis TaxID=2590031 RepID=A0A5J5FX92_9GAMM|nr:PTS sugar transporter subunit IIA [Affinibrenneria salicis]KAA8998439.1 PTS sugar transporter subunit IIA [Affinibrenneria salicis]